jgi:hypothetical protein
VVQTQGARPISVRRSVFGFERGLNESQRRSAFGLWLRFGAVDRETCVVPGYGGNGRCVVQLKRAQQFVAGERGIARFSTCFIRRGLRAPARAT